MSDTNKHIIYSASDIKRYLDGNMTPLEMHALEKAALDDPFLAEAMEGYESVEKNDDWSTVLGQLKDSFTAEQSAAPVITMEQRTTFKWWKAAAAVLIIGGGISIFYISTTKKTGIESNIASIKTVPESPVVKSDAAVEPTQPTAVLHDSATSTVTVLPSADDKTLFAKLNKKVMAPIQPGTTDFESRIKAEQEATVSNETRYDDAAAEKTDAVLVAPPVAMNEVSQSKQKIAAASTPVPVADISKKDLANYNQARLMNRSFNALVVGTDNKPLPFANVTVLKENIGTYADVKGKFNLVSNDSVLHVEVKSIGYLPATYTLQSNNNQNKIVLKTDDNAFRDQTVVTGYGNVAKKAAKPVINKDSLMNVEPDGGWSNYDTYLNNNLSVSESIRQKNIHGEVEVSFDVSSDGNISNLKVNKSLCNDCDEEALRLVKEGPQWKLKKGKKGNAKVKLQF